MNDRKTNNSMKFPTSDEFFSLRQKRQNFLHTTIFIKTLLRYTVVPIGTLFFNKLLVLAPWQT